MQRQFRTATLSSGTGQALAPLRRGYEEWEHSASLGAVAELVCQTTNDNFEPSRWPAGPPDPLVCNRLIPFGEYDSSPTKTFMVEHRFDHGVARLAELAFGKRPAEELYDLRSDPEQLNNICGTVKYAAIQQTLRRQLFDHLTGTRDPRVVGVPDT